jgi:phytoene synthase
MPEASMPSGGGQAYRFPNNATPPGSAAYYCIRFGARQGHPELALLFAWRTEVRRIQEQHRDPGVARLKLDWWRREIDASLQGRAHHPLAQALTTPMRVHQLPLQPFTQLLDAAEADVLGQPIADDTELWAHCEQTGGGFAELLTRVAGGADRRLLEQARALGVYVRLAEIVTELGADLRRERCYLPRDRLASHRLSVAQLSAGEHPGALTRLLAQLTQDADRLLPKHPLRSRALGPAAALADLGRATLEETARAGFPVLESQISLTAMRRLWISWRSGRRHRT